MKISQFIKAGVLVGSLGLVSGQASAIVITGYTSFAAWQAAAGGSGLLETFDSETVRNFSNPINETGFNGFSLSGSTAGDSVGIKNGAYGANINGTNLLGYNGGGTGPVINFDLNVSARAFAFNWRDTDSTDEFRLEVAGFVFTNPPSVDPGTGSGFFGVVATGGSFSTATIRHSATIGGFIQPMGFDNIRTVLPEPLSIALLGLGLAGLGFSSRRRLHDSA